MSQTVTIPLEEYLQLRDDSIWVECLNMAGVDNWDGFDEARQLYKERDLDND